MAKKKSKPAKKKSAAVARKAGAANKSGAPKKSRRTPGRSTAGDKRPKVKTQFVTDFVIEFIGHPGAWKWPDHVQSKPSVAQDFFTILNALVQAGYLLSPPTPGTTDSLQDRVENFLLAQNWPLGAPIQKAYQGIEPTIRLVEISQITDHLLQAIDAQSSDWATGSGSGWPPH
jgi:hypothetical protein